MFPVFSNGANQLRVANLTSCRSAPTSIETVAAVTLRQLRRLSRPSADRPGSRCRWFAVSQDHRQCRRVVHLRWHRDDPRSAGAVGERDTAAFRPPGISPSPTAPWRASRWARLAPATRPARSSAFACRPLGPGIRRDHPGHGELYLGQRWRDHGGPADLQRLPAGHDQRLDLDGFRCG